MKIVVIGAGALGSLVGGLLARSGQAVTLYNSSNHAHILKIRQAGLLLETPNEKTQIKLDATTIASELSSYDLAIILVKAYSTKNAVNEVSTCLNKSSCVLSLQNGYGFEEDILKFVSPQIFLRGTTTQGATLLQPGHVCQAGRGLTHIGPWQGEFHPKRELEKIIEIFNQAGLETHLADSIRDLVWKKLIVNSAINPLAALFAVANGALIENPDLHQLLNAVTRESIAVANAMGFSFSHETLSVQVEDVCKRTAHNINSMLQDFRQSKPTEIDFINGAIVREAQRLHIAAPLNQLLLNLVKHNTLKR